MSLFERVMLSKEELKALKLSANPFPGRPHFGGQFVWPELSQVMLTADSVVADNGMMSLIGPVGSGKSLLLSQLRDHFSSNPKTLIIDLTATQGSRLDDRVLEITILEALDVPARTISIMTALRRRKEIVRLLQARAKLRSRTVILGDDMHDATFPFLKALRKLRESDPQFYLFSLILAGQPALGGALRGNELDEVGGRMDANVSMPLLAGVNPQTKVQVPNMGLPFLEWHYNSIQADVSAHFTPEGAAALADVAQMPLWTKNLAMRALQLVAKVNRPLDPAMLAKLMGR